MKRWNKPIGFLLVFAATAVAGSPKGAPAGEEITRQVAQLGDEASTAREAAMKQLSDWAEDYPRWMLMKLSEEYRETESIEARLRLREVMIPLARVHLILRPKGFMGVNLELAQLADGTEVIRLQNVLPDKAAEHVGLKIGDLLLEVDGKTVQEIGGVRGFSNYVAGQTPGSIMEVLVIRNGKPFLAKVPLVIRDNVHPRYIFLEFQKAEEQIRRWLAELEQTSEMDPTFPVGHFPEE